MRRWDRAAEPIDRKDADVRGCATKHLGVAQLDAERRRGERPQRPRNAIEASRDRDREHRTHGVRCVLRFAVRETDRRDRAGVDGFAEEAVLRDERFAVSPNSFFTRGQDAHLLESGARAAPIQNAALKWRGSDPQPRSAFHITARTRGGSATSMEMGCPTSSQKAARVGWPSFTTTDASPSHSSRPEAVFGLGSDTATELEVRWPSGRTTPATYPPPGRLLVACWSLVGR